MRGTLGGHPPLPPLTDADPLPPELVAEFLERLALARAELDRWLAAPGADAAPIRRLGHQLRGAGGAYGYPEVTTLAGAVEDAAPAALPRAVRALADHLRTLGNDVRERLLVVDDDPVITALLVAALGGPQRQVMAVATTTEAEAALARDRCDLVLLDLFLADEDGRRLLQRWRTAPETRELPVFILSADVGPEVKRECYVLGADGYFEKPLDVGVLAAAVEGRLARAAGRHPAPAPPAGLPRPAAPGPSGPARILVADDDRLIVSIVTHRLGKAGHSVLAAADGGAALRAIAEAPPDLLILDVKMPVMDGHELLRRLRADPGTRTLPVILLTALGGEEDVVKGFALGADDYLVKPFSPTELTVRVDRLLQRR